jgi:hypothetical protein
MNMQGVFQPAHDPTPSLPLDAIGPRLGAPLVQWEKITAIPDTVIGRFQPRKNTVYSPLPCFKIDEFTFFIVPKTGQFSNVDPHIRLSNNVRWLKPYTATGSYKGAPFSHAHEKEIKNNYNNIMQTNLQEENDLKANILTLPPLIGRLKDECTKKAQIASFTSALDQPIVALLDARLAAYLRPAVLGGVIQPQPLPNLWYTATIPPADVGYFRGSPQQKNEFVKSFFEWKKREEELRNDSARIIIVKRQLNLIRDSEQIEGMVHWPNADTGAELDPYTLESFAAERLFNYLVDLRALTPLPREPLGQAVFDVVEKNGTDYLNTLQTQIVCIVARAVQQTILTNHRALSDAHFNGLVGVAVTPVRGPRETDEEALLKVVRSWIIAQNYENLSYIGEMIVKALYPPCVPPAVGGAAGPVAVPELPALLHPYTFDIAVPFRHFIPRGTAHVYDIDEDWLRQKVEKAERLDYEFALRIQGLSGSTLNNVWAPRNSSPLGNGNAVMKKFAQTLVDHFFKTYMVENRGDYSPESVVREVVAMHSEIAGEWARENKNTLTPGIEASAEAYVSLFTEGPLSSSLKNQQTNLARVLRRDERFRIQFAACLHLYMNKSAADRVGTSGTYKQITSITNQHMLAVKSFAFYLAQNTGAILRSIQEYEQISPLLPYATLDPKIHALFNPYTMDWFQIADQLPLPRSRFPGYTHPEGEDQNPENRQTKWQKVWNKDNRL